MNIAKELEQELDCVREENPMLSLQEQLDMAADRLTESLTRIVYRERDRYWWKHQEAVNLAFFE